MKRNTSNPKFEVGVKYKLKYQYDKDANKDWQYIMKVLEINKEFVVLEFYELDGTYFNQETHSLKDFLPKGGTIITKLSKLDQVL